MRSQEQNVERLERHVLRAFCAHPSGENLEHYLASLSAYAWRDEEHRVIYEAMRRIAFLPLAARRQELASQVTRMGFPDVTCALYFEEESTTPEELTELIRRVRAFPQ